MKYISDSNILRSSIQVDVILFLEFRFQIGNSPWRNIGFKPSLVGFFILMIMIFVKGSDDCFNKDEFFVIIASRKIPIESDL